MHVGKWVLALGAFFSILTGAAFQTAKKAPQAPTESPLKLFQDAKQDDYIGDQACAECHAQEVEDFHKSSHATFSSDPSAPVDKRGCEGCHGPCKTHKDEEGGHDVAYLKMKPADVNAACLRCHQDVMKASQWHHESHARAGVSCVDCHQVHPHEAPASSAQKDDRGLLKKQIFPSAKATGKLLKTDEATLCAHCHQSEVAEFRQNSHHPVPEGRLVCSDCHQVHPTASAGPKNPAAFKQSCVNCHADKAGPFIYEHDPVAGWMGNGCLECHRPHGSHNPDLLNSFSRGLCAQCHTDKLANHFPGRSCWNAGCHIALHGSNSDSHFLAR